jgi:hypothetical protein
MINASQLLIFIPFAFVSGATPLCRLTQPKRVPAAPIWGSRAKVVSGATRSA